jgi:hypothetical protein
MNTLCWLRLRSRDLVSKFALHLSLAGSIKDVQKATREASSPPKIREHPALKTVHLFTLLWVIFAHLDPDTANQNHNINPDPGPKHQKVADYLKPFF